jgi:ribosomal protein S12 methylthiotransferase
METQAPDIDGSVLINDVGETRAAVGEFYETEITDSLDYDLVGRIVESEHVRSVKL